MITAALTGNPNAGKTTLFNLLTGSAYRVGNWAGVTVEKKEGKIRGTKIKLVDLPGIYSLSPCSKEEEIAREFIDSRPDIIINIVDATNLERNLYLTTQLLEKGVPTLIALNMIDSAESKGIKIDVKKLSERLGTVVVPISAKEGIGINELIFFINKLSAPRFKGLADEGRYLFVLQVLRDVLKKPEPKRDITDILDSILLNKFLAVPFFSLFIGVMLWTTFTLGGMISDLFTDVSDPFVRKAIMQTSLSPDAKAFLADGVWAGVGGVAAFFPQIMIMFLFLSFLEDSGYMARAAFITDRLFMRLGLSGKFFVPLVMGFGCSVPAIMSTRTLETERERRIGVICCPFMSCSARMTVYALFAGTFFDKNRGLVVISIYLLGIAAAALSALLLGKTLLRGQEAGFITEIPPYRMPAFRNLWARVGEKLSDFAGRTAGVIMLASIIIWILQAYDFSFHRVPADKSMIFALGRLAAPAFSPLGFGNSVSVAAIFAGIGAKEAVVSALEILGDIKNAFTPLSAYAFMVFILLYTPCIAALSATFREMKSVLYSIFAFLYQTSLAYLVSFIIFQAGSLLMKHLP